MLIADEIKYLCGQQRLFSVEPLDWRTGRRRHIYVSLDVHRFLTNKSTSRGTNNDRRLLQALFDQFISGDPVSIALEPTTMGTDIKRLSGAEVWEFKVAKKKHLQLRVFGRFAEINVFIALTGPFDRTGLNYSSEIVRCEQEWQRLFDRRLPLFGEREDDYICPNGVPLRDS
jgi:hypothetical protein